MPTYKVRIKEGMKHGRGDKFQSGDELVVGEAELLSFKDKFEVLEEVVEKPASPTEEPVAPELEPEIAEALAEIEEMLGEKFVEEDALATLEELAARMRQGEVPKLAEVVGPKLADKLEAHGLGEPVLIFYASDETLLAVDGVGPNTLDKLRAVYGESD